MLSWPPSVSVPVPALFRLTTPVIEPVKAVWASLPPTSVNDEKPQAVLCV
jgi:hypothetical protein